MLETEGNVLKMVTAVRMIKEKWAIRSQAPLYQVCLEMIGFNVLPTLALLVVNVASLRALVTLSPSCAGYVGKVHRLDGGRSQQSRGIRVGLDVLLRLKV